MRHRTEDRDSSRKYFTQLPNILFTLPLTTFEFALYAHLKRTAGETGKCWKSTTTLAKETGMSTGMISKAKIGLQKPRTELSNKPLITISEEPGAGKAAHLITLIDIWPENIKETSRSEIQSSPDEVQSSHSEVQRSRGEVQSSHSEIKKNPLRRTHEENPMKNNAPTGEAGEVFVYWRDVHGHPTARLDDKRRKVIEARLKQYSTEELKLAIDGCKLSAFHQGENDRNTIFDDISLICRDASHVDQFIAKAQGNGHKKPANWTNQSAEARRDADDHIERMYARTGTKPV